MLRIGVAHPQAGTLISLQGSSVGVTISSHQNVKETCFLSPPSNSKAVVSEGAVSESESRAAFRAAFRCRPGLPPCRGLREAAWA